MRATVIRRYEGDDKRGGGGINPPRAPGRNNEEDLTELRNQQQQPTPFGAAVYYLYRAIFSSVIVEHKVRLMGNPTQQAVT